MATDAQSLLGASNCYLRYGANTNMLLAMMVQLLAQLYQQEGGTMAVDAASLLSAANCYLCNANGPNDLMAMAVVLLSQLVNSGGGGGVTAGYGTPTATPATGAALYIQIDSAPPGQLWEYYSGAWH